MKQLLILCVFIINSTILWAQSNLVPYRVGQKFGLSNLKGDLKLEPQFDLIDQIYGKTNYFNAYKINGNKSTVSFIHNDKILIKDQPFTNYRFDANFIFGYKQPDTTYFRINQSVSTTFLFDTTGKPLFTNNLKFVSFLNTYEALENSNQFIMLLTDQKGKMQLVIWNKSTQKVEKILLDKIDYKSHTLNKNNYKYKLDLQYLTATKQLRNIIIDIVYGEIEVQEDIVVIKTKNNSESDNESFENTYGNISDFESENTKPYVPKLELQEEEYISIIEETYASGYPRKKDIIFRSKFKQGERHTVKFFKEDNLLGIKSKNDSVLLAPIYDDIYSGSIYTAILKKDGRYGLYIYNRNPDVIIEPMFEHIPVLGKWLYQPQDGYILKLYKEDGTFFCYAAENGTIYYSPQ